MATFPTFPLSPFVSVSSTVEPVAPASPAFNAGLIVGNSGVIPSAGANSRTRQYASTSAMLQDGFEASDPEYLAAQLYYSQSPAPSLLYVGAQDPTAIQTAVIDSSAEGTGYVVGDTLTAGGAGTGATFKVTAIGAEGAITTLQLQTQGTGYAVATGVALTGGTGTAAELNITAIGETLLQAVTACRIVNANWYTVMACGAVKADHIAIAEYIQSATPQATYIYATADADAQNGLNTSVFAQLQAQSINRALGIYSTTQGGVAPNNAYAAAAIMGVAMGLNTGLPGSNFVLAFKTLVGVTPENGYLDQSQQAAIQAVNGNTYITYGNGRTFLSPGTMGNGQFFDIILGVDMLASDIQQTEIDLFMDNPSIPQNNPGEALLLNGATQACERSLTRGFIGPGVWDGTTVGSLANGTSLPSGYYVQAQSFTAQSTSDQQARKGMPIAVSIITANGIQSITISVPVQQ
jgi:hypothetical protein